MESNHRPTECFLSKYLGTTSIVTMPSSSKPHYMYNVRYLKMEIVSHQAYALTGRKSYAAKDCITKDKMIQYELTPQKPAPDKGQNQPNSLAFLYGKYSTQGFDTDSGYEIRRTMIRHIAQIRQLESTPL